MEQNDATQIMEYCKKIAEEFGARRNLMRVFITQHNLSVGNANESILRDFLDKHAPTSIKVGQGFICNPTKNEVSKQCDILAYDQALYPLVYSDGDVRVVWPDSAKMVIEVKTSMQKADLADAVNNIVTAKRINKDLVGIIFAFGSSKIKTVLKNLQEHNCVIKADDGPSAIFLFDEGIMIYGRKLSNRKSLSVIDPTRYMVHKFAEEACGSVVSMLLLMFFLAVEAPIVELDGELFLTILNNYGVRLESKVLIGEKGKATVSN